MLYSLEITVDFVLITELVYIGSLERSFIYLSVPVLFPAPVIQTQVTTPSVWLVTLTICESIRAMSLCTVKTTQIIITQYRAVCIHIGCRLY